MEPFVPEPDERIAHQSGSGAKGKADNHSEPATPKRPPQSGGGGSNTGLIVVSVVFLILLIGLYFIQQSSIKKLESQLALTGNQSKTSVQPADNDSPTLNNQVSALSKLVDSQVIAIYELRKKLAEGSSTPETSTSVDISALEQEIEKIKKSLQAMTTIESDDTTVAPAVVQSLQADIAALKLLKTDIDELRSQQTSDIAALMPLKSDIDELRSQQQHFATLDSMQTQLETLKATLNSASTPTETPAISTDWQDSLERAVSVAISRQSSALADQSRVIASMETQLENSLRQVDSKIANLNSDLASQIDTTTGKLRQDFQTAQAANPETAESLKAVQQQMADYQGRLDELSMELAGLNTGNNSLDAAQLTAALAPLKREIEPLKSQITSLRADIDTNRAAIQPLRTTLNALNNDVSGALSKLQGQQKAMAQLEKALESRVSLAANNEASSQDIASLTTRFEQQVRELKVLKSSDEKLATELRSSRAELQSLQRDIARLDKTGGGVSVASAPSGNLDQLKTDIANLNSRTDSVITRLQETEANLGLWKSRMENQLTSQASAPSGLSATDREIIKLLMKQHPYTDFPGSK